MSVQLTPGAVAVLGLGVLGLGYIALKTRGMDASQIGESITSGAINAATGAATGAVKGIGQAVGIPETSADQCSADLAAGRTWDASFSCPADRWITEGVLGPSKPATSTPAGAGSVPSTDKCSADLAAGRTWDASFSCPAGRWIKESVFGSGRTQDKTSSPASSTENDSGFNFLYF